jgi:hypothetical protein
MANKIQRERRLVICVTEEEHAAVFALARKEERNMNTVMMRLIRNALREAGMPVPGDGIATASGA